MYSQNSLEVQAIPTRSVSRRGESDYKEPRDQYSSDILCEYKITPLSVS